MLCLARVIFPWDSEPFLVKLMVTNIKEICVFHQNTYMIISFLYQASQVNFVNFVLKIIFGLLRKYLILKVL